jgi:hypothetical protein
MKPKDRIKILKKAQQAAPAAGVATPTTNIAILPQTTINLDSIPGFRRELFAALPNIVNDIQKIINIINKNLLDLTGNKVSFNITWNSPSITGSEYSDDAKNLITLAKWILNVIRSKVAQYNLDGLRQFADNFFNTVNNYSLSPGVKNELLIVGTHMKSLFINQPK